jgi:hypothetical protein
LIGCLRFLATVGASDHVRRRVLADPQNTQNDMVGGVL